MRLSRSDQSSESQTAIGLAVRRQQIGRNDIGFDSRFKSRELRGTILRCRTIRSEHARDTRQRLGFGRIAGDR